MPGLSVDGGKVENDTWTHWQKRGWNRLPHVPFEILHTPGTQALLQSGGIGFISRRPEVNEDNRICQILT
jgi:hypothetical protein